MNKPGKIRILILTVITLIMVYLSVGYTYEMSQFFLFPPLDSGEIYIDGSDFTLLFKMMAFGMNSAMAVFLGIVYFVIVLIAGAILIIPFRLIGIRKDSRITIQEYKISKIIICASSPVSVVVGLILSRFSGAVYILTYTAVWVCLIIFVYLLALKKKTVK